MDGFVTGRRVGVTRRLRLKGHDYREGGYYFLTVTIQDGRCLLGRVVDSVFLPSAAGAMVQSEWEALSGRFAGASWDMSCVMPNHFHALIGLGIDQDFESNRVSISSVMQAFKSITTVKYGTGVRQHGWPSYGGRLWHTGFHDYIVREERDLDRIRDYIESNPAMWNEDRFYRS